MEVTILSNAPEALKRETNKERREFIQHIINTDDPRRERKELRDFLRNDSNKERYPDEYEEKQEQWEDTFKKFKEISANYLASYPKDVMNAYKKLSKAFDANLREVWYAEEELETSETNEINLEDTYYNETIEVSYTFFGYDRLGETTFDMDVKEKEYEWLSEKEGEGEYLDSDFISENRRGLHKRILKAIRNNMKDEALDPDDGMVEYVSSAIHRKDFFEDASYDYASDFADDDDIEYMITL